MAGITSNEKQHTPMNPPKIEIGEEYFLRVYVAEIGKEYLVLETLSENGEEKRDEAFFCLPKKLSDRLI